MTLTEVFTFEELTDRDLAILDNYVWGKDVPVSMTTQLGALIAQDTVSLRRRIDAELERRNRATRTYRTEGFKSLIGSTVATLTGADHG